jgi:hypothetical protein
VVRRPRFLRRSEITETGGRQSLFPQQDHGNFQKEDRSEKAKLRKNIEEKATSPELAARPAGTNSSTIQRDPAGID